MLLRTPIRLVVLLLAAYAVPAVAQEQSTTPAHQPPSPARVSYSGGRITVAAENASLNQILSEISQQTGMKITGGVNDERVYGSYGPASPANILAELLDGTGTNMMLVQSSGTTPAELILTPRNGGPTPPNPNAAARAEEDRGPIGRRMPNNMNRPNNFPQTRPEQVQRPGMPGNNTGTPNSNSSQPGTTTQQSPNSNLTPQQLFEQRRRAAQQGQQSQQDQQAPQGIRDPLHRIN